MDVWTEVLQSYLGPELPEAVGRLRVGRLATQALCHNLIDKSVYESVLSQTTYKQSVEKLSSETREIIKEHNPLLRVPELDQVVAGTDLSPTISQFAKNVNEHGEATESASEKATKQRTGRITVLDESATDLNGIQQLFRAGGVTAMLQHPGRSQLETKANVADFSLVVGSTIKIATTFLVANITPDLPQSQQTSTIAKFIMDAVDNSTPNSDEVSPIVSQWHSWRLLHLQVAAPHLIQLVTHLHKQLPSDLSINQEGFGVESSEDHLKSVCCVIGNSPLFFLEQIPGMNRAKVHTVCFSQ